MGSTLRIADMAVLRRIPVNVEPGEMYREIGIRSFGRGIFRKEPVTGASLGTKRVFEIHPGIWFLATSSLGRVPSVLQVKPSPG